MTKEELKQSFIHGNVGRAVLHCDEKSVSEGLESLTDLISKATTADSTSSSTISSLQNLNGFYGVVKNNCLSEDNLLYDLDIPSYGGDNTEHVVEDFQKDTQELIDLVTKLKADIEATVNAINIYNNRDSYSPTELAAAAEGISLFDDYSRLGEYANKYTEQQFGGNSAGSGGGSGKVGSYSKPAATAVPTTVDGIKTDTKAWEPVSTKSEVSDIKHAQETKTTNTDTKTTDTDKKKETTPLKSENRPDTNPSSNNPSGNDPSSTKTTKETTPIQSNSVKETTKTEPIKSVTYTGTSGVVHAGDAKGFGTGNGNGTGTTAESKAKEELAKKTSISTGGSLASSISSTNMRQKSIDRIEKIEKPIDTTTTEKKSYILPTAAALSASAAAGIGTKAYIGNYSNINKEEEEKKEKEREEDKKEKEELETEYTLPETEILDELDDRESSHDNFKLSD